MSTIDISNLSDEQLAQMTAEARRRKMMKTKSEKYSKYEPVYSAYRLSVTTAKKANDEKKRLLAELKVMGFGVKPAKSFPATTPKKKK